MVYEVIARKWRPQQFDDVVGQAHVTDTLKNAIKTDRIAHAYLFVGPRGIGKTSVARIFAKALNCVEGPTETPCNKCDSCKEITLSSSLDVLEIDGASNNGVDQVRDLRDTVKYAPARGPYKIYIIDEVHMLSTAAFNALLKTLEEPPPHVKFIFATTEPQKILATIISRCQRFDLRRIPVPKIVERLKLIAESEKVKVSDDALLAIARGAEGGLRDAASALDQLISFKGNTIDEADVLSVFGLVSRRLLEQLAEKILRGDIKGLIADVAELDEAGKDLQRLILELMEHFRNLLICKYVDDGDKGIDLTEAQYKVLQAQAALTTAAHILRIMGILTETEDKMRYALSRRTITETGLIRCARAATVVSLEEILEEINKLKQGIPSTAQETPIKKKRTVATDSPPATASAPTQETAPAPPVAPEPTRPVVEKTPPPEDINEEADLALLLEKWEEVLDRVSKLAIRARSFLVDARPVAVHADRVVINFDPEFADEIDNFKAPRNRHALENALKAILKRKVVFELNVGTISRPVAPPPRKEEEIIKSEPQKEEEDTNNQSNKKPGLSQKDLLDDPAVQRTLETFNGSIMDIRR